MKHLDLWQNNWVLHYDNALGPHRCLFVILFSQHGYQALATIFIGHDPLRLFPVLKIKGSSTIDEI